MHIILGGTGQVGSATARSLLEQGEPVTVVTRDSNNGAALHALGATMAEADIRDISALRAIFQTGRRAMLINPPADPSTDTDREERKNSAAIIEALTGSGLEKVVLASTYGARPGERCGDLTVLHEMEEKLRAQPIPAALNRGAYYMSNWAGMIGTACESGILPSFFPAGMTLPMVAPEDLGQAAAKRLLSSTDDVGIVSVEGPERYAPTDVAEALGRALNTDVTVDTVPRDQWLETFVAFGFSDAAAASYACMTAAVVDGEASAAVGDVERGETTLRTYIANLLALPVTP